MPNVENLTGNFMSKVKFSFRSEEPSAEKRTGFPLDSLFDLLPRDRLNKNHEAPFDLPGTAEKKRRGLPL